MSVTQKPLATGPASGFTFELLLRTGFADVGAQEILESVLLEAGVNLTDIIQVRKGRDIVTVINSKSRGRLQRLERTIKTAGLKHVRMQLKTVTPADWKNKWKDDFKPFVLSKNFVVVPYWMRAEYKSGRRIPIYLGSGLAFGTGLHETTRFMVGIIEQQQGRFRRFLDVGTGTGILSIAAASSGAKDIRAVDLSADAVKTAKENFCINGLNPADVHRKDAAKVATRDLYDFVAANLITRDLLAFGRNLAACVKPGGLLAVSGVSIDNVKMFKKEFKKLPLRCLKIIKGEEWAAFLYKSG